MQWDQPAVPLGGLWTDELVGCTSGSRAAEVSADIFAHPSVQPDEE